MNGIGPIGESMGVGRLGQSDATAPQTGEEKGPSKKKVDHGEEWVAPSGYLTCDNGSDPILGPPYPPSFYQAFVFKDTPPRLRWTIPNVMVTVEADGQTPRVVNIVFTGYSWPSWSAVTTYIRNSRVTGSDTALYYSLVDDNLNNDPISSPSQWAEDVTHFKLFIGDPADSGSINGMLAFSVSNQVGDSTDLSFEGDGFVTTYNHSPNPTFVYDYTTFVGPLPGTSTLLFHATAEFDGATVASPVFSVVVNNV